MWWQVQVAEYNKVRGELLREEAQLLDDVKLDYKSVTAIYGRMLGSVACSPPLPPSCRACVWA